MRRGRRMLRWAMVPVLAGLATAVVTSGAGAAPVAEQRVIGDANWYWRAQQVSPVDGSPVLHDPGDDGTTLVVSGPTADGEPERMAVVQVDASGLPDADRLLRALLVLPVAASVAPPAAPPAVEEVGVEALPTLVVCLARGTWRDGDGARPLSEAPAVDCAIRMTALPGPDGAYRVDVSTVMGQLASGDATGLVLLPDATQPAPYELRFGPRSAVVLDVLYETEPGPAPTTTTTTAPPPAGGGGGGGGGGLTPVAPLPTVPPGPVDDEEEAAPARSTTPAYLDLGPVSVTRAPLAVFVLFALIGALGLLFFSPSQT